MSCSPRSGTTLDRQQHPLLSPANGPQTTAVSSTLWIILGVAVTVVVCYLLVMRVFYQRSRELEKQVDYTRIKKLKDEDD